MPHTRCVICGAHENNVEKLHYFPTNPEKSKLWQEILGITYEGASYLLYSLFSYVDLTTRRLNKNDAEAATYMAQEDIRTITPELAQMRHETLEPVQMKHDAPKPVLL